MDRLRVDGHCRRARMLLVGLDYRWEPRLPLTLPPADLMSDLGTDLIPLHPNRTAGAGANNLANAFGTSGERARSKGPGA